MRTYRTLNGTVLDLTDLSAREKEFLRGLKRMAESGLSYFEIERTAIGPGSPALEGRNRVDRRILRSPLYLAARDIATRIGIAEGLLLAPEHADKLVEIPSDRSLVSVTQAASLIGISRAAVHKAIAESRLRAHRFGNVVLVERAAAEAYRPANKPGAVSSAPSKGGSSGRSSRHPEGEPAARAAAARAH